MAEENIENVSEKSICFYIFTFDDITLAELQQFDDFTSSAVNLISFLEFIQLHKVKYNLFTLMGPMFSPEIFDFYMHDPYTYVTYVYIAEDLDDSES